MKHKLMLAAVVALMFVADYGASGAEAGAPLPGDPPRVCHAEDSRPCVSVMQFPTDCPNGVIVSLWARGDGMVHFPSLRVYYDYTNTAGASVPRIYEEQFDDTPELISGVWFRVGGFQRTNDVRIVEGRGEFSAESENMALTVRRRCKK